LCRVILSGQRVGWQTALQTGPIRKGDGVPARRTSTTLADGRELIYFDDTEPYRSGARRRDVADGRPLDVRPASGTMRLDALTGDWVSIAGHRQSRTFLPPTSALSDRPAARP